MLGTALAFSLYYSGCTTSVINLFLDDDEGPLNTWLVCSFQRKISI